MSDKPRILHNQRDMIWSLVPLLILCVAIALISGNFAFGGKSDDKVPAFDVKNALKVDARTMSFPIRLPATPSDWKPNSGRTGEVGGKSVSNVGYITADGIYLQLTQTDATEEQLVGYVGGKGATTAEPMPVGDRKWIAYDFEGDKKAWTLSLDDVRIGLYGKAGDADFRTLAEAVASAAPIPKASAGPVPS